MQKSKAPNDGALASGRVDVQIKQLIDARAVTRAARNFKESDRIRDERAVAAVLLEDKPDKLATGRRG